MGHDDTEATTSRDGASAATIDRRAVLGRLAATGAVAWAAPEILATRRAQAQALSGCYIDYDFDSGTLEGWAVSGSGPARWQISSLHTFSGSSAVWFGRAGTTNSLHPVAGQPSYHRGGRSSRGTLTSPTTTVASTDVVSFQVRLAIESATQYDVFRLFIVQGGTRVQIWDKHQSGFTLTNHPENPSTQWDMYTTNGAWEQVDITIGTPSGIDLTDPVQFEFDFQTVDALYNRTEGIYLDNIMLPCGVVTAAVTASTRASSDDGAGLDLETTSSSAYRPPPEVPAPPQPRDAPA